jgi:hypothetical protein
MDLGRYLFAARQNARSSPELCSRYTRPALGFEAPKGRAHELG